MTETWKLEYEVEGQWFNWKAVFPNHPQMYIRSDSVTLLTSTEEFLVTAEDLRLQITDKANQMVKNLTLVTME